VSAANIVKQADTRRRAAIKPVAINAELLDLLEPAKRLPFFKKWQGLLEGK